MDANARATEGGEVMSTYIRAVVAAKAIAEKHGIPLGDLVDTFADSPAVDVAPVRRGRWIATHDEFCSCSVCKYPVYVAWGQTNYCPNCGAQMDEKAAKEVTL